MAKKNPEHAAHQAWLGLLQPVGLVVSAPALVKAQAVPRSNAAELQQEFISLLTSNEDDGQGPWLDDFPTFVERVLRWQPEDLAGAPGGPALPDGLEVALPELHETLRPTHAVLDTMSKADVPPVLLLVKLTERDIALDEPVGDQAKTGWHASPQAKFERLLRETGVPAGILCNRTYVRIVYAPRGESSGHLTFPVAAMAEVSGRPILAALEMLLSEDCVFSAPEGRRLADLLVDSRKYQNEVSTKLADQVLGALWDLLAGFQAADVVGLGQTADEEPDHVYGGLLSVLMRLVFLLYAEDEDLLPGDAVYVRNYSVTGLFERLRADAGRYPDTMDERFGAWAALLSTFRLIHDGGGHGGGEQSEGTNFRLPARHGELFNPDEYPFLEGRPPGVARVMGESFSAPRVSDGCIHRVLEALLVLDGERLSYRALDVEQIGSVYEAIMGFGVERAAGRSIATKPKDVVLDVEALLEHAPAKRKKKLKEDTECDLTGKSATALKSAKSAEDVVAALGRRVSPRTPRLLSPGSLYLQPGEERRRSGSHYTPRELTEPIVRTTLRPVLENLGKRPTPQQILDLEVCDPAMGSGAFLVETCRQLAEALVEAWEVHDNTPDIPPDEDPLLHARRLVAQRCLHGVDKNPFAVSLAKLSLWLVTLARDHAFTFLDHALKHGDSLVGLTRKQIGAFHWKTEEEPDFGPLFEGVTESINTVSVLRNRIQDLGEGEYDAQREVHREAEEELGEARLIGDLIVAAFFSSDKNKLREGRRLELRQAVDDWKRGERPVDELWEIVADLRQGEQPVSALHWEIEYPEVFGRPNPGFDAIVGNPPFLGGKRISTVLGGSHRDWLAAMHPGTISNADIVAHFFRRAFGALRQAGAFGLVATNTVAQGDTRHTGLRWICTNGGTIYSAKRRLQWPGIASVVVSVVHVRRGGAGELCMLDGNPTAEVTAFLFHAGGHTDPGRLLANEGCGFIGTYVLGMGFTFDDADSTGVASSIDKMHELLRSSPANAQLIDPYIGGAELNHSPSQLHQRYVINFGSMSLEEARAWPDLLEILSTKVKPARLAQNDRGAREKWWQFIRQSQALRTASKTLERVLVTARISNSFAFAFVGTRVVCNEKTVVFAYDGTGALSILQGRPHEIWARFFSSSLKDDMQYTPSDCFETFPFPPNWQVNPALEAVGETYYTYRADLMIRNNEGLTKTYNRFHDPNERSRDIQELRELHAEMDRAVLDAYGWTDIPTDCEFLLDYEIDEETWGNKKKPYRYRWPDDVHDEVLARLLELNKQRAEEERLSGLAAEDTKPAKKPAKKTAKKRQRKATPDAPLLPGLEALDDESG